MRKLTGLIIIALSALGLAALLAPSSAQTPIAPEATPEFWPLAFDPASVEVDPDAGSLLFQAPRRCQLSPDSRTVFLEGYGFYDLAAGRRIAEITGIPVAFSPTLTFVHMRGDGVYNYETGALVVSTAFARPGIFSPDGRWFVDDATVYDLQTGEPVADIDRSGDTPAAFIRNGAMLRYESDQGIKLLDTATWQPPYQQDVYDDLLSREGAAQFYDGLVWIPGDGVYDLFTGERRVSLPDAQHVFPPGFDATFFTAVEHSDIVVYRIADGTEQQRITVPDPPERISRVQLSPDNGSMVVVIDNSEYFTPTHIMLRMAGYIFDVATGQMRGEIGQHFGDVTFFPENPRYASALNGAFYDLHTGEEVPLGTDARHFFASFKRGGTRIFTYGSNGMHVIETDTMTAKPLPRFPSGAIISDDGRWVSVAHQGIYEIDSERYALTSSVHRFDFDSTGTMAVTTGSDCAIYRLPGQ